MDLYINSTGIISGAGNNMSAEFLQQGPDYNATALPAVEPDYKEYIPVMQLRRMSKAVRMGVVAAKTAMQQAGIEKPDAISVGTAYGCLQDTEAFLGKMIDQDEQMLTPTAFIQSTHNTVSGQIALLAGCNGHNLTFVQRGHSFEHALINAKLYLDQHEGENILVGGIDEQTPVSIKVLQQAGAITTAPLTTANVLRGDTIAAVGSEGAAFFCVTQHPLSDKYIRIKALDIFMADEATAFEKVQQFANKHNDVQVDLFLSGANGMAKYQPLYNNIQQSIYPQAAHAMYKHLCGDYPVASSFALGMLQQAVQTGTFPASIFTTAIPPQMKHVVMVNNFGKYYSCWLLELAV